uniref:G protein-coupled receptor n=1 Tax=Steinernema glaseri TaxID=37863 RepID=A0A1I8AT79_9BILA
MPSDSLQLSVGIVYIISSTMPSDSLQLSVGIVYIMLATLLAPPYARIVYIFISMKKYRDLECYRIMAQTGIVQLATAPTAFLSGFMQLTGFDVLGIAGGFLQVVFSASVSVEIQLNLCLALNRLKVIVDFDKLEVLCKILMALGWLYGAIYVGFLLTPFCGFFEVPGQFIGRFDFTMPYTWLLVTIDSYVLLAYIAATFCVYVIIIVCMIRIRLRIGNANHIKKERSILIYACVRFIVDANLQLSFYFYDLPHRGLAEFMLCTTYILNSLFLSPFLNLTFNDGLRHDFFDMSCFKQKENVCLFSPSASSNYGEVISGRQSSPSVIGTSYSFHKVRTPYYIGPVNQQNGNGSLAPDLQFRRLHAYNNNTFFRTLGCHQRWRNACGTLRKSTNFSTTTPPSTDSTQGPQRNDVCFLQIANYMSNYNANYMSNVLLLDCALMAICMA